MSGAKKSAASAEPPQLDRSFEQLLLQLSATAAQGCDFAALVRLFCRATREFFDCSGVFCWKLLPSGELFGFHGDGYVADRFAGTRLKPTDTSAAVQAVQTRRAIYRNAGDTPRFHEDFPVLSVLSAPLIAAGEITGAVTLVHVSEPRFFHDGIAEKTTILAGLLAGFMEASRLTRQSRDERRRSELLVQCAEVLHSHTDVESVLIALAERVREILSAQIVVALLRAGDAAAAIARFRSVIRMNPTHYGAHYQLAAALDRVGRPREARPLWETVLRMAEGYRDSTTIRTARARLVTTP